MVTTKKLQGIYWLDDSITSHQYKKTLNENFIDSFEVCNVNQLVTFPTQKENTLDLLLSNRPDFLKTVWQSQDLVTMTLQYFLISTANQIVINQYSVRCYAGREQTLMN